MVGKSRMSEVNLEGMSYTYTKLLGTLICSCTSLHAYPISALNMILRSFGAPGTCCSDKYADTLSALPATTAAVLCNDTRQLAYSHGRWARGPGISGHACRSLVTAAQLSAALMQAHRPAAMCSSRGVVPPAQCASWCSGTTQDTPSLRAYWYCKEHIPSACTDDLHALMPCPSASSQMW